MPKRFFVQSTTSNFTRWTYIRFFVWLFLYVFLYGLNCTKSCRGRQPKKERVQLQPKLNPMRTTCQLVKMNILSFIEPIRERVRKNGLICKFVCIKIWTNQKWCWKASSAQGVDINSEYAYCRIMAYTDQDESMSTTESDVTRSSRISHMLTLGIQK